MNAPLDRVTASTAGSQRPSRADQRGFERLQATAQTRALDDAKAWRNGYAMLAGGLSALLGFIGTQLDHDTSWVWRLALTILLGGGLLCVAAALALVITVEGGRRTVRLNLREIVKTHNSLEAYQAQQAAVALERLDRSKGIAALGAGMAFVGLVVTLWMPGSTEPATPPSPATSQPSSSIAPTTSPPSAVAPPSPSTAPTTSPRAVRGKRLPVDLHRRSPAQSAGDPDQQVRGAAMRTISKKTRTPLTLGVSCMLRQMTAVIMDESRGHSRCVQIGSGARFDR